VSQFDLILHAGTVHDGTGVPGFPGDIGLRRDEIAAVGDLSQAIGPVIDCAGLHLAPGFIDVHNHSDLTALVNPEAESMIRQGVTTMVTGQCGFSPFPVKPGQEKELDDLCPFIAADVPWTWHSTAEYLERLAQAGPAANIAPMVGHSALRAHVFGFGEGHASPEEIAQMGRLLEQAFDEGVVGLSFGFGYAVGKFAAADEVGALCRIAARRGKHVSFHIRNEGAQLLESLDEAIDFARDAASEGALRLQIDHLKASGQRWWGKVDAALERIDAARREGFDVAYDVYPYTAGSAHLWGALPGWMSAGGHAVLMARLRDPQYRQRLHEEQEAFERGEALCAPFGHSPEHVLIIDVAPEEDRWMVGKRLDEIAATRGGDGIDAAIDLLISGDGFANACFFSMCEEDVRAALRHPVGCIGTDGMVFAPYGSLSRGAPHPRSYGTFPRLLGKYVRDERLVSLAEAVRKCTSLPASRLGLTDRGRIAVGMKADIIAFDAENVADAATYEAPHQYPQGIELVIVNGCVVIQHGRHFGPGAGQIV